MHANPLQSRDSDPAATTSPNTSEAIVIREAAAADLEVILHHRRAMFHEMGHTDKADLEAMLTAARISYAQGLRDGSYRGWLALDGSAGVIGGGGIGLVPWPPHPQYPHPQRAGAAWPAG